MPGGGRSPLGASLEPQWAALRATDALGALSYRVWYYAALQYDEDLRDNGVNGRRQQVQILFARQQQASAWFNPELLSIPLDKVRGWMEQSEALRVYRFAIENLYRQQEHVLDDSGERLMSLASRLASSLTDRGSAAARPASGRLSSRRREAACAGSPA